MWHVINGSHHAYIGDSILQEIGDVTIERSIPRYAGCCKLSEPGLYYLKTIMKTSVGNRSLNLITHMGLRTMAFAFNHSRLLKRRMKCSDGWINFSVGICTETGSVAQTVSFNDGRVRVAHGANRGSDVVLKAVDDVALKDVVLAPPSEVLNMMLRNKIMVEGNLAIYHQVLGR